MRRQVFAMLGLMSALGFVVSGCGGGAGEGVKVSGSVVKGGAPQPGVNVSFIPDDPKKGESKGGRTDDQGKFELRVKPASYTVVLTKLVDKKGNVPSDSDDPTQDYAQLEASGYLKQAMPAKFTNFKTSPFKVEIPPEGKNLEPFDVK